ISGAEDMEGLEAEIGKGKMVAVPLCSSEKSGEKCAEAIRERTAGNVRGTMYGRLEAAGGKCIVCGRQAKVLVYVARQY
ncbi:MAG: hypothetical protein WC588_04475, partial [Candidatus Micrarchaeia archaeon]